MSDQFDPYHVWLGIPPEEQPPSHYRLLGLRPLEADGDVISKRLTSGWPTCGRCRRASGRPSRRSS